jgi:hypothetical protein
MKKLSGGFGIAEALIALTVMGLGLAALSQGLNTSLKAQKNLDSKLDFTNQMRGVADFLRDPANCATLVQVGTQMNANSKMSFFDQKSGKFDGPLGKTLHPSDFVLTSVELKIGQVDAAASNSMSANLEIAAQKKVTDSSKLAFGGNQLQQSIPLRLYVDAANKFVGCEPSLNDQARALCKQMGSQFEWTGHECSVKGEAMCKASGGYWNSTANKCARGAKAEFAWAEGKKCIQPSVIDSQSAAWASLSAFQNKATNPYWADGLYMIQSMCSRWCAGPFNVTDPNGPQAGCGDRSSGPKTNVPAHFTSGTSIEYDGTTGVIQCFCTN